MNLNQLTIPSTDLVRSSEFYRQLGLTLIVDAIPRYARFECPGGSTMSLHRAERVDPESGFVIYFECTDLDDKVEELREAGVEFESGPRDDGGIGGKRACEIPTGTWCVSSTEVRTDDIPHGASTACAVLAAYKSLGRVLAQREMLTA